MKKKIDWKEIFHVENRLNNWIHYMVGVVTLDILLINLQLGTEHISSIFELQMWSFTMLVYTFTCVVVFSKMQGYFAIGYSITLFLLLFPTNMWIMPIMAVFVCVCAIRDIVTESRREKRKNDQTQDH